MHFCSHANTRWPNLNKQFYFIKINLFVCFFKPFCWFDGFSCCSSKMFRYFSCWSCNDRWKLEDPETSVRTYLNNFPLKTRKDQLLRRESRSACSSIASTSHLFTLSDARLGILSTLCVVKISNCPSFTGMKSPANLVHRFAKFNNSVAIYLEDPTGARCGQRLDCPLACAKGSSYNHRRFACSSDVCFSLWGYGDRELFIPQSQAGT